MFNPKENLLDQQLAVSGLEMQIAGVFAGVSAVASLAGGIIGSNQAKKANEQAQANYKAQQKAAKKAAAATNKYNQEAFEAEKENYFNNKAFQYETAVKNWKYSQAIKDYEYASVVKQYAKSVENTENQLIYNSIAAIDAYEAEQSAFNDILTEDAFNKQGALVDRIEQVGQASLGQAGNARLKGIQSRLAGSGRNSRISDAALETSAEQFQRNMKAIGMQKYAADLQAKASMMIQPEAVPDIPKPEMGPDMIFVEPMKATPAFIPAPIQQSTMAPLVSGIGSAASALEGVNWSEIFPKKDESDDGEK